MHRPSLAVTAVIAGFLLAGCGSSVNAAFDKTPTAAASSQLPQAAPALASAQDVVDRTGCTYEAAATVAPFAATYGTCDWHGDRLQVYTFASIADEVSFLKSVRSYGVVPAQLAMVDLVIVAPKSPSDLPALRTALGAA